MKRTFSWAIPALVALWIAAPSLPAKAQGVVDATAETAADVSGAASSADTAADAAGSTNSSAGADVGSTNAATDSSVSGDVSSSTDASTSSDNASANTGTSSDTNVSGQADVQSSSQPRASVDASATQDASTDASVQAGASADVNADNNTPPAPAQPENATDPSASIDANTATGVDATVQGRTGVNANSRVGARQDLAAGLQFGQATDRGLAINTIPQNHYFYNSGLRRGDVIVSYGGRPIRSHNDFRRWAVFQPGQRVPVVVLRQGRPETIYVVYDQRQPGLEQQAGYAQSSGAYLGVTFDQRHQGQAVIRTVNPGSPAEQAGLQPGDLIVAVNGTQVGGSQDVIRVVSSMQPGQAIDVAVSRQVVLGQRPGVAQAASYGPDVRVEASATPPAVPAGPAPTARVQAGVYEDATVRSNVPDVPGTRVDNRVGRAADADNDGRAFDGDGRVGPAEGRAILPRRRN